MKPGREALRIETEEWLGSNLVSPLFRSGKRALQLDLNNNSGQTGSLLDRSESETLKGALKKYGEGHTALQIVS
jgi:hypothetical protein